MKTLQQKLAELTDAIHRRARAVVPRADVLVLGEHALPLGEKGYEAQLSNGRSVRMIDRGAYWLVTEVPGHIRDGFAETVADGPELFAGLLVALERAARLPPRAESLSRRR